MSYAIRVTSPPPLTLPDPSAFDLLPAVEEVLGAAATAQLLRRWLQLRDGATQWARGLPLGQYGLLEQAIEDLSGARAAGPLLQRVGRASYRLADVASASWPARMRLRLDRVPFRARPARVRAAIEQFIALPRDPPGNSIEIEEDGEAITLILDDCSCADRPQHQTPCCHLTLGLVAEAMERTVGRTVELHEVSCRNLGADACRYRISK